MSKEKKIFDSVNPNFKAKKSSLKSAEEYVKGILSGNRTSLSQAITLIESSREDHRELSEQILEQCLSKAGDSIRIGISGVPGVGKSTFIDTFGKKLISDGKKIAVLTVDPSSSRSKGSILGDKTRMHFLSTHPDAYIRPSPTAGTLGGVAKKTRETMLLCEAAGYEMILIETVGVGQSETAVYSMVDFFLVLMLAGAGDELQGIKRGILEMADLIAVNKSDGDNVEATKRAKQEYQNALSLFPDQPSGWKPVVKTCSSLDGTGLEQIWEEVKNYITFTRENGHFENHRKEQTIDWMYENIHYRLQDTFYKHPAIKKRLMAIENKVAEGTLSSFKAASELIKLFQS